ncbi:MAG: hypothetical protein GY842_20100 [bacterium]|nr:hypothetical protein [bacterium]
MIQPKPLSQILDEVDRLSWTDALCLPRDTPWTLQTRGVVVDPDKCPEAPGSVVVDGHELAYTITVQHVQDVKANALAQRTDLSAEQLLKALKYYCKNDAFVSFRTADG